jgi:hypothetical protein
LGEYRNEYINVVGKYEGKKPLGRLKRRWDASTKMDLKETRCGDVDWINLAQDSDR